MEKELQPSLISLFDQMPGAWGCKDKNSVFMYANHEYKDIIGLGKNSDLAGMTDYDMPCETVNCASLFRQQDKAVIRENKKMKILDIHPFAGNEWKIYIFTKTPLLNEDKEIAGTIFNGIEITSAETIKVGSLLSKAAVQGLQDGLLGQNSYMLGNHFKDVKLTGRLSECLFFMLRGKTAKQIAKYMNISFRTVEAYAEQLKMKFGAANKYELLDKAIEWGFLNTIPESLFHRQLSIILADE